ncbi:MAG TPA: DUF4389 domain-containing protein [Bacillota bacterium]|nr:DUF4389 domain-containing protein [Bacillota bacterium]
MKSVQYELAYPEKLSRGVLLLRTFFGWLYVGIPHYFCLFFVGIIAGICSFLAFWAVLFTGKYPASLFNFVKGSIDWQMRVGAYFNFLTDEYPAFGLEADYPAKLTVAYPEKLSRGQLLLRCFFGFLYVGIPHGFCLFFRMIAHAVVQAIAWWVVLFTGKMPQSMFSFMTGTYRWAAGLTAYLYFMTDEYPPFTGKAETATTGTGIPA